jgi:DMSO/TMAO reductase YedYZ molybdopterin-dependent catalytic subunit
LLCTGAYHVWAKTKRILLNENTDPKTLIRRNPAELDTRNLRPTALKDFGTMGLTDFAVDLEKWRLEVTGEVMNPFSLTYQQILDMPPVERKVLLICPGFFANHGNWKGISIGRLLEKAGIREGATHVEVQGPKTRSGKVVRYPIADVLSDKVFLAYAVNGQMIPQKHGFPLRVVAEDYFGDDWVKYVGSVRVLRK